MIKNVIVTKPDEAHSMPQILGKNLFAKALSCCKRPLWKDALLELIYLGPSRVKEEFNQ